MKAYKQINKCRICNSKKLINIINLNDQYLQGSFIKKNIPKPYLKKIPLQLLLCTNCLLVQLRHTTSKNVLYKNYWYESGINSTMRNHLKNLAHEASNMINKKNMKVKVLDIGCNDGTLLDFFSSKSYETFGIEPTNAYKDCDKRHTVLNRFFDKKTAKYFLKNYGSPDIIVFTNVFAHIEKFKLLIENLKYLKKKETIFVIENHYLISVLKKFQFDTFYHEHLRTYSLNSFFYISKLLNMKITKFSFPKRYGGNIRIFYESKNIEKKSVLQNIFEEKKVFYFLKKKIYQKFKKVEKI